MTSSIQGCDTIQDRIPQVTIPPRFPEGKGKLRDGDRGLTAHLSLRNRSRVTEKLLQVIIKLFPNHKIASVKQARFYYGLELLW